MCPQPGVPRLHRQDNSGVDRKLDLPPTRTSSLLDHVKLQYFTSVAVTHAAEERIIAVLYWSLVRGRYEGEEMSPVSHARKGQHHNAAVHNTPSGMHRSLSMVARTLLIAGGIWCASVHGNTVCCVLSCTRPLTGIYRLPSSVRPLRKTLSLATVFLHTPQR